MLMHYPNKGLLLSYLVKTLPNLYFNGSLLVLMNLIKRLLLQTPKSCLMPSLHQTYILLTNRQQLSWSLDQVLEARL